MQFIIDSINKANRLQASLSYNLGRLVQDLSLLDPSLDVIVEDYNYQVVPVDLVSWRGSYDCLALQVKKNGAHMLVKDFLEIAEQALVKTFLGCKGGEYSMDELTPIYCVSDRYDSEYTKRIGRMSIQTVWKVSGVVVDSVENKAVIQLSICDVYGEPEDIVEECQSYLNNLKK